MQTDYARETMLRELDHRIGDGIEVSLLWNPESNQLALLVIDVTGGEEFAIEIAPDEARDAFLHPFAYAGIRRRTYHRLLVRNAA
jgi:hypothetical protein